MAFVNERISPNDLERYGIEEIDKKYIVGGTSARDWTIDRERDVYLRNVATGREEFAGHLTWTLYWKGYLIEVGIEMISIERRDDNSREARARISRLEIPLDLAAHRDEILNDLRSGLVAYKDGGIYATASHYKLTLDV